MDGKDLLKALMKEANLNPNALADILKNRSLQSQITRYVDGSTRNPRWDTLKPVADYFEVRVEAFFDPDVAAEIAGQRGFTQGGEVATGHGTREEHVTWAHQLPSAPPVALRSPTRPITLYALLIELAEKIRPHDQSARRAVSSLLADLALSPETAPITAARIERLLQSPGNDQLPQSINSPASRG